MSLPPLFDCLEGEVIQNTQPFYPSAPETLEDTNISLVLIEELVVKLLLSRGVCSGREVSDVLCLPFQMLQPILMDMKNRMLVTHRTTASLSDFCYSLTEQGRDLAVESKNISAYVGSAPVIFDEWVRSIYHQSIRNEAPSMAQLRDAYGDMVVDEAILNTLGPAINSGRGLFLFGEPGNGKTSLAERISAAFEQDVYIPRTLWIEGELVQLYDPQTHEEVAYIPTDLKFDRRWVKIKRPTVVVGGELTLDALEIRYNPINKVCEAPLQMKANCGVFLIDDFGRQRVNTTDLLNRWIVPLEKRYDFLVLPNGKKIQVPFDELIIFSTNLNPSDLVDDAFLRRIPYKVEVKNPTESEFRALFQFQCERQAIPYDDTVVSYLIDTHYRGKRDFRCCQPRDLLDQVLNQAAFRRTQPQLTTAALDEACQNYFAAMGK